MDTPDNDMEDFVNYILNDENELGLEHPSVEEEKRERDAADKIIKDKEKGKLNHSIDEDVFRSYLQTKMIPEPELMIRTSGEYRISNFLLWQMAYTELYFTDVLWPDFDEETFYQAIYEYQKRERRFGKTSDQLYK